MQESPTSDITSNGAVSPQEPSSSASSSCCEPLEPKFQVKVTQPVKDGNVVKYTLRVRQVGTSSGQVVCHLTEPNCESCCRDGSITSAKTNTTVGFRVTLTKLCRSTDHIRFLLLQIYLIRVISQ